MPADPARWAKVKSVVAGRLINCYCASDTILHVMYRSSHSLVDGLYAPAGLTDVVVVDSDGGGGSVVENVDLGMTGLGLVKEHVDYQNSKILTRILKKIGVNEVQPIGGLDH